MINEQDLKDYIAMGFDQPKVTPAQEGQSIGLISKSLANAIQVGGDHYKQFAGLEPWDVITRWNLGYLDGTALKYIARWQHKGGIEDLEKAIHFLRKCIEVHQSENRKPKQG